MIADKLLAHALRSSHRLCATVIITAWHLTALAELLGLVQGFRLWIVLPISAMIAVASHRMQNPGAYSRLKKDIQKAVALLRATWRQMPFHMVYVCAGVIVTVRLARGIVLPPFQWDSLTYHLVKSANWVQSGGPVLTNAPDAWSYYDYFPRAGEILWAWAMLPVRSDALVGIAGLFVWIACVLCTYAAGRALSGTRKSSMLFALIVALSPAVMAFLISAYVDNVALTLFMAGIAFLLLFNGSADPRLALIAGLGFALSAAVKTSFAPAFAVFCVFAVVRLFPAKGFTTGLTALALLILAVQPIMVSYWTALTHHGSPLYPVPLKIGGYEILPGNQQLIDVVSGEYGRPEADVNWLSMIAALFHFGWKFPQVDNMNLGPGFFVFLLAGAIGLTRATRRLGLPAFLTLIAIAILPVYNVFSSDMLSMRGDWWYQIGRLIMSGTAVIALFSVTIARGRLLTWLLALACLLSVLQAYPVNAVAIDYRAMGTLVLVLVAPVAGGLIAERMLKVRRIVVIAIASLPFLFALAALRQDWRHRYYMETSKRLLALQDLQPVIWRALDRDRPLKLAITAGWSGVGHNWFVYPLLGSRLQNTWQYVPPTCSGKTEDLSPPPTSRTLNKNEICYDYDAWIRRLKQADIDVVVALAWPTKETEWMRTHPETFSPLAASPEGLSVAYKLKR